MLTARDIAEIRRLWAEGVKQEALAREFRVSQSTISRVISGGKWGRGGEPFK